MDKPIVHRNQQQQHVLKCPRCDSSNTKFCYYNNYSLSQPRHFCKACKRYWTKGGTLRNVPAGGGCRKNKRVKKPSTTSSATTAAAAVHSPNPNLDHNPSANNSSHRPNSLFYGSVPQNPHLIKFDSRVYDLQPPQMNPLGLGFSSAISPILTNHSRGDSNTIVSSSTAAPPMGSLLPATLDQQERFAPYEYGCGSMDWAHGFRVESDRIKPVEPSDLTSMLWNTADESGGGWLEPTNNIGS